MRVRSNRTNGVVRLMLLVLSVPPNNLGASRRSSQPFKECYSFDTCYNQNFTTVGSYDEEDMTWVEYQWLARRNYDSPRMVSSEVQGQDVCAATTGCGDGSAR